MSEQLYTQNRQPGFTPYTKYPKAENQRAKKLYYVLLEHRDEPIKDTVDPIMDLIVKITECGGREYLESEPRLHGMLDWWQKMVESNPEAKEIVESDSFKELIAIFNKLNNAYKR